MMNKHKIGFIVVTILILVLSISNIWFFIGTKNLETKNNDLQDNKNNLEVRIDNLKVDKNTLENRINDLQEEKTVLEELKWFWFETRDNLNIEIRDYKTKITELNSWLNDKEIEINTLYSNRLKRENEIGALQKLIDDKNLQIELLQLTIDKLQLPDLVSFDLTYEVISPTIMKISGTVINMGNIDAKNVALHFKFSPNAYIPEVTITEVFWARLSSPYYSTFSQFGRDIHWKSDVVISMQSSHPERGVTVNYSDLTKMSVYLEWDYNGTRISKEVSISRAY